VDCKVVCVTAALLAAGCVPRAQGISAAVWADSGGTFLGVLASYLPTSEMFGGASERSEVRVQLFEQAPSSTERTPVGAELREDVFTVFFMKRAGYVLYRSGSFDPYTYPPTGESTWKERSLQGVDTTVLSRGDMPSGFSQAEMVPSWTGTYQAVVFRADSSPDCRLEVRERAARTAVFTHLWECFGASSVAWQPDDSLVVFESDGDGGRFKVQPPEWTAEPLAPDASPCTLGTSSAVTDAQGRSLLFSPLETEVTVVTEGKVSSCLGP
jgi:hypothetical protein